MSSLGNARVSVLFANGTFGIWELDARNELKAVRRFSPFSPGCPRLTLAVTSIGPSPAGLAALPRHTDDGRRYPASQMSVNPA